MVELRVDQSNKLTKQILRNYEINIDELNQSLKKIPAEIREVLIHEELFDSMSRSSAALRDSSLPMLSTMNSLANPLSVDFYESEDMYHLDADLPGVKKEDLKIERNDEHVITIEAKKIQDECSVEDDDGNVKDGRIYHRMERSIVGRSLRRSLRLPQDAIIDNLKAKFQGLGLGLYYIFICLK